MAQRERQRGPDQQRQRGPDQQRQREPNQREHEPNQRQQEPNQRQHEPNQRQHEPDYCHRSAVDKLGIKPGSALAFAASPRPIDPALQSEALDRAGRSAATDGEPVDVALVGADATTDVIDTLQHWRTRLDPAGGIWLLTPKRGQTGYIDQRELIDAGPEAGLVDNKICSVDERTRAMRFVIRKTDRVYS